MSGPSKISTPIGFRLPNVLIPEAKKVAKNRGWTLSRLGAECIAHSLDCGAFRPTYKAEDFAELTQKEAIIKLASQNGGAVSLLEAKRLLVETGLTKATTRAGQTAATFNAITRTGRFEQIGPGKFRLKQGDIDG